MVGTSPPVCRGFTETETFNQSKADLKALWGLTDEQIDDRLESLLWGLARGGDPALAQHVSGRNLWASVIPGGIPPLRVYWRPDSNVVGECQLLWVEDRFG